MTPVRTPAAGPGRPRPPARPRVLYVTHRVPYPPDKGDRIRNYHLLRQLAAAADVSLVSLADEPVPAETMAVLRKLTVRLAVVPATGKVRWLRAGLSVAGGRSLSEGAFREPAAARVITEWAADGALDAAVVSASSLAPYLWQKPLAEVPGFVDLVDVDSQKWADFAAAKRGPKRLLYSLEARRVRKLERMLPGRTAAVGVVSRAEADVFEAIAGTGTATVATNGVDQDYYRPADTETAPACAFVGALDYLPNIDAACWFAREVWPQILATRPDAELRLIGRKPAREVQALAGLPWVKLVGQVPDVRPHVATAAVVVVPMRLSRGLQNKVLEAMAMGKAVVAAPPALAALAAIPGRDLLEARTPADWVEMVVGLLADAGRRAELGRNAREFVERNHHWDRCLAPFTDKILAAGVS